MNHLVGNNPVTVSTVLEAADRHALEFLTRLEKLTDEHGPDGILVRNEFDAILLRNTLAILREKRDEQA